MKNKKISTRTVTFTGLFTALVYAFTMISFPNGIGGYAHFGDSIILICATVMNPYSALIAGSIGSALADVTLGYAFWVPWTLAIKAIMALMCGFLVRIVKNSLKEQPTKQFIKYMFYMLIYILTELFMSFAYFGAGYIIDGFNISLALTQLVSNFTQMGMTLAVVVILVFVAKIDNLFDKMYKK